MAYSAASRINNETCKEPPFITLIICSIVFHAFVLVVVPLLAKINWHSEKFDHPKTIQLVSVPSHMYQKRVPITSETIKQRVPQKEEKPQPSPLPKKEALKKQLVPAKEKESAKPVEENVEELESLLDELPMPAQVSAVGDFKYNWYIANVQQKLERYWNPSTENKNVRVEVAFTIYSDGNISEPRISKSSGNSTLDNLALRAVKLAAPFGKLPPGFSGDKLELNCTLIPTRK